MIKYCLLVSVLFFSIGETTLEDHFKKVESHCSLHSMENIDFIYMINLDQRPEKFAKSFQQLNFYGIYPYRFSAVNGWELSWEVLQDVGVKFDETMSGGFFGSVIPHQPKIEFADAEVKTPGEVYFCHRMTHGAVGIVLSHLSILQDAYDAGFQTIWVMEDDIEVVRDPNLLSDMVEKLDNAVGKENWDILFTDKETRLNDGSYVYCRSYARRPNFFPEDPKIFGITRKKGRFFRKIGARYGAYSMIVRRSGMEKLLRFFKQHKIFLPYDMDFYLPPDIQLYTVVDDIVRSELHAPSDNGKCGYLQ